MPDLLPREKLIKQGVKSLSNQELIQVVVGSGVSGSSVVQISNQVLAVLFNSNNLYSSLQNIKGVSLATATKIIAGIELGKRISQTGMQINQPQDALPYLQDIILSKQENLVVISLDGGGNILGKDLVTIGIINQTLIHPREVFAPAINHRASSIILAHNHPSGNLTPSSQDLKVTSNLYSAGIIMGIKLDDHIIVSIRGFYSFKQNNQLTSLH